MPSARRQKTTSGRRRTTVPTYVAARPARILHRREQGHVQIAFEPVLRRPRRVGPGMSKGPVPRQFIDPAIDAQTREYAGRHRKDGSKGTAFSSYIRPIALAAFPSRIGMALRRAAH